jgi:hypothetical protein
MRAAQAEARTDDAPRHRKNAAAGDSAAANRGKFA